MLEWASLRGRVDHVEAPMPPRGELPMPPEGELPAPRKPGIALALGGGAARGWAHIGVLRALDEASLPIDMIAGTSIGALVGGCYLAGKLDELEDFARSLTRRRLFGLMDFQFARNGLFGGMRLTARMQQHLDGLTIENLDRPFVCVATEIRTGHEIWLSNGSLITAMRASYALPGVFEPVMTNGRLLVDGALVNPVPVSVCRAYEQPLVVAVNLHYDNFGRAAVIKHSAGPSDAAEAAQALASEAIGKSGSAAREARLGITGVMVEAFNIIQDRISRSRLAGDPPDLSLQPKLGHIGLTEFWRADELIQLGYEVASSQLGELQRLQAVLA